MANGDGAGHRRLVRRRHRGGQCGGRHLPATRIVFVETIANPRTQIADLAKIGALCKERGILYIVDNTMTTPYLFPPESGGRGPGGQCADEIDRRPRQCAGRIGVDIEIAHLNHLHRQLAEELLPGRKFFLTVIEAK